MIISTYTECARICDISFSKEQMRHAAPFIKSEQDAAQIVLCIYDL